VKYRSGRTRDPAEYGNVARLCAATKTRLHLIEPLGFSLDDKQLKRAGMDYWQQVEWQRWPDWKTFQEKVPAKSRIWFIESDGPKLYSEVQFAPEDYLCLAVRRPDCPKQLLDENRERWLRLPMFNAESRSLNLSNCAAIVLFEALRQQGLPARSVETANSTPRSFHQALKDKRPGTNPGP